MIRPLACAFVLALVAGCAAAPPPKDYNDERVMLGDVPQPYFLRRSNLYKHFINGDHIYHWGLVAEDGRVLVPLEMEWTGLLFVNEHWAIGKTLNAPTYTIVRLPEGTMEQTPYVSYQWWTSYGSSVKHMNMHSNPRWNENLFDITFMDAKGRPAREYKDLGGATVSNQGWIGERIFRSIGASYICMDTTMPDGNAVSRLITLDGIPGGPILPRFASFEYLSATRKDPNWTLDAREMNGRYYEWGWPMARLEIPGLPDPRLLQPATADGLPVKLPEGAAGMIALTWKRGSGWRLVDPILAHSGWAIAYPTKDGFEYAVGLGTVEELIQRAASLPRYDGLRKVCDYDKRAKDRDQPLLALKKRGQPSWELVTTDQLAPVMALPEPEVLATYDALIARWERYKRDAHAKWVEAEKARVAAEEEKRRKERELHIAAHGPYLRDVLAGRDTPGRFWTLTGLARDMGLIEEYKAHVARKLREESVRPTPHAKFWISESRELGSKAHEALVNKLENDAAEARLKEHERQRVEYDNWAKFARAAEEARISANASSPNPAMSGYTDTYKRNMEAWNKGQLNWFTPEHLKK